MDDLVAYGPPIVEQKRNEHDLLTDLTGEIPGMRLTDGFVDLLRSITLTSATYLDAARELTSQLQEAFVILDSAHAEQQTYWQRSLAAIDGWLDAYTAFSGTPLSVPASAP